MNHWIFEAEFPVFPFKCWVWYSRFLRSWDPWGWMKVLTSHSVLSFCKKLCFTLSGKGYKHKMHFRANKKKQNQWHECFDVWWCFTYTKSINIIYNIVFIPFLCSQNHLEYLIFIMALTKMALVWVLSWRMLNKFWGSIGGIGFYLSTPGKIFL